MNVLSTPELSLENGENGEKTNPRDQALSTSVEGGTDQELVLAIDEITAPLWAVMDINGCPCPNPQNL